VAGPKLVGVDITMLVRLDRGQVQSQVRRELLERFGEGVLPSGELAFFHPDRYTFGAMIYKSRIVAEAMQVDGVRSVDIVELKARRHTGSDQPEPDCTDAGETTKPDALCKKSKARKTAEALKFREREIPHLLNNPAFRDGGRLKIVFCENDDTSL
jgi:hypothetical protein